MSKPKNSTYSGAVLRAMRDERAAAEDPATQARRHEASFLGSLSRAQDDYEWLVANEAWLLLGHESFAAWWGARVQPLMRALSMRPTRELARDAADRIRDEEADLPSPMRRREREIAEMVGATPDELRDRQPRSSLVGIPAKDDLEETSGLVDTSPVDESGENRPATAAPGDAAQADASAEGSEADQGDETGSDSSPGESGPVAGPERQGAGVSPAAPAPELVDTPIGPMTKAVADALDKHVPDPNPHREWQKRFLDSVFAAAKAMRGYSGAEIAEKADAQLRAEFARFVGDMESLLHETSQAQLAAADNVRPLRRVQ